MFSVIPIQPISNELCPGFKGAIDVLRLDRIHTVVSGNKWFKLQYYLEAARKNGLQQVATFGGAFSNHIVATAYAAKLYGLKSMGVIRGEKPAVLSHTLQSALDYGMQLKFVSRTEYKNKARLQTELDADRNFYWIDEGGYGDLGAEGIRDLFKTTPIWQYTHLLTAVGTGTTMAGLIKGALPFQQVIGVSVLKNNHNLRSEIGHLLSAAEQQKEYQLLEDNHFGGYAKKTPALLEFMNYVYQTVKLPLDFVYTAKAFYGLLQLFGNSALPADTRVLFVHTGGLQGNLSLPPDTLCY